MKTSAALTLLALMTFITVPAAAVERSCRPSLSNAYHCPVTSAPAKRSNQTTGTLGRACHPSLSNLWTCAGTSEPRPRTANADRPCRPSLSNGYNCTATSNEAPSNKTSSAPERGCRPSWSNGYQCPGEGQAGPNQYSTETLARAHCPADTVVWANTRSDIYHFRGSSDYGTTKVGFYMCEQAALAGRIRAAKNEKHP